MLRFGIFDADEFRPPPRAPRIVRMLYTSRRVSLQLLRTHLPASAAELRVFQYLVTYLRLSSGVHRTTYPGRFQDVDRAVNALLVERFAPDAALDVHDWAASDCLTSFEWAASLYELFPRASVTASDLLLFIVEVTLPDGSLFIVEPDGHPLQYVRRPFVIRLDPPEPMPMLVNRWIGRRALARLAALQLRIPREWLESDEERLATSAAVFRKLPLTHPQARLLAETESRFAVRRHSAFEPLERPADVIRTMNIFNRSYFSPERLGEGSRAVWRSLRPGGLWIVGRTAEDEDGRNHAGVFERTESGFRPIARIGRGSEIEELL